MNSCYLNAPSASLSAYFDGKSCKKCLKLKSMKLILVGLLACLAMTVPCQTGPITPCLVKRTGNGDCFFISRRSQDPMVVLPSDEELFSRVTKRSEELLRKTRNSATRNCLQYFVSAPPARADYDTTMSLFSLSKL